MTWLNSFVTTTAFKYLVAMASTFIAAQLGLAEGEVTAFLTQLVGLAMMGWGMWEASRNKVVVDGTRVSFRELPGSVQREVKRSVEDKVRGE